MVGLKWLRKYSVLVILLHDTCAVVLSWWIAFFVRYNFNVSSIPLKVMQHGLKIQLLIVAVHLVFYWRYKTYRPLWRFFSLPELSRLTKAIFSAWILNIVILFALHDLIQVPKSIWFIYPLWLILILGLSRLTIRYSRDKQIATQALKRILIVGAGKGAELFLREMARWPEKKYLPIASLDDDVLLKGKEIRGVPILGSIALLSEVIRKEKIDLVVVAIPSIQTVTLQKIVTTCEEVQVDVRVLPTLREIEENRQDAFLPREVLLEDLLGRDPVQLDWDGIKNFLFEQVVLVSGGGGSIGSVLCQEILKLNPKHLVILDHSEFNLYDIEKELLTKGAKNISIELINITDVMMVRQVMKKYKPTIVFHAAAYKHVPILEFQVFQAVKNNMFGTKVLAEAAVEHHVKKFIMVSTDKAVNPTNIMGATKRIAELFCQSYNKNAKTAFITVRFGNVIGSTGSVIPLFKKQIKNGGPITVTHPDMTRYFMTIKEASQLILQAGAQGSGGEIFVLDMGQPVKIVDLANKLIKLSGKEAAGVKIKFTGLRPGEKLYEELFYEKEQLLVTDQQKIFKVESALKNSWDEITQQFASIEMIHLEQNENRLIQALCHILGVEGSFLEKGAKKVEALEL